MTAPERVYLHIGLHKTGTTFLQNLLRANREQLRAQGVEFPGGPGEPSQGYAVWDLQGRRPRGVEDKRIGGQWDALVEHVNGSGMRAALVSEEHLSLSTIKQARAAVEAFPDSEVHVVVTVRDIGRVVVSAWQEEVKNDKTWTWQQFVDAIKDPAQIGRGPARGFWLRQDAPKICETWEAVVPASRIHVVTVPPSGASPDALLSRFASVVGFDPALLTEQAIWNNETVGVAAIEVIRRLNERLDGRLNQREHDRVVKLTLVQMLAKNTEPVRFTLPPEEVPWAEERAAELIAGLAARGYPVEGDLDELRPRVREGGRRPDDATDDELLEASLDALTLLSEKYAKTWWMRKREAVEAMEERGGVASRARSAVFKGQRKAAAIADTNPVAAKAVGVVLKARDRRRQKAIAKKDDKAD